MKIDKVYVGGWFHRTTLHLSEIHDFFKDGTSQLGLSKTKLEHLHQALDIKSSEFGIDGLEYLEVVTNQGIHLRIFEDGLVTLGGGHDRSLTRQTLPDDINQLTDYYENRLSPAISYIFSLGSPMPKELTNIETIYPYFVVLEKTSKAEMLQLLEDFHQDEYTHIDNEHFDVIRGDKLYIINAKTERIASVSRFVEEQIFLREFKGQLHHYLNLHRAVWDEVTRTKEMGHVKGRDISKYHDKLEGYSATINLADSRIDQMGTYMRTREQIAKDEPRLRDFFNIIEYRYETLADTLVYIQEVWEMTTHYLSSTRKDFASMQTEMTNKSVQNLTVVTSMGVGGTLIGLFTTAKMPEFTVFGLGYFVVLVTIGYFANRILKWHSGRRKYHIKHVKHDDHILKVK